jgi:hypothetical protein
MRFAAQNVSMKNPARRTDAASDQHQIFASIAAFSLAMRASSRL